MKTLGRIVVIVVAFVIVMGITYGVVNATNSSMTASTFERGAEGFPRPEGMRPALPDGERPDFDGAPSRGGGSMFVFGSVKNIGVLAFIVMLIALPKRLMQRTA
jgi:hypothetical protein